MTIDNKGGQPIKWNTPKELKTLIDAYYVWAKENVMHVTVSGLAWWLGCSRQTLINYEYSDRNDWLKRLDDKTRQEYVVTVKEAKQYIEMQYEQKLYDNKTTTGAIFTLKINYAWCDKQEIVTTTNETKLTESEIDKQLKALSYKE